MQRRSLIMIIPLATTKLKTEILRFTKYAVPTAKRPTCITWIALIVFRVFFFHVEMVSANKSNISWELLVWHWENVQTDRGANCQAYFPRKQLFSITLRSRVKLEKPSSLISHSHARVWKNNERKKWKNKSRKCNFWIAFDDLCEPAKTQSYS